MQTKKTIKKVAKTPTTKELSVAEKYYIQQHASTVSLKELSTALSVEESEIETLYEESKKKASSPQSLLTRDKKRGIVTMTKAAAEAAKVKSRASNVDTKHIHKIKK